MTKDKTKLIAAGAAIGSAAIAAAVMYASKRKKKAAPDAPVPVADAPETD